MSSHLVILPPFFLCCSDIEDCAGLPMHIYQKNDHLPIYFLMRAPDQTAHLKKKQAAAHPHFHYNDVWKRGMRANSMGAVHWEKAANDPAVWTDIRARSGRTRKSTRAMLIWEEVKIFTAVPTMIASTEAWIVLLVCVLLIFDPQTTNLEWRCHTFLFSVRDMQ